MVSGRKSFNFRHLTSRTGWEREFYCYKSAYPKLLTKKLVRLVACTLIISSISFNYSRIRNQRAKNKYNVVQIVFILFFLPILIILS